MFFSSLVLAAGCAAIASAETIHGIAVVSRHGDRTSKHYAGYGLTNLGYQQAFDVGSFYRSTYLNDASQRKVLGISTDKYISSQLYAASPDQQILLKTTTGFLQGLYPPFQDINALSVGTETINNGSSFAPPLNGYQFVFLRSKQNTSPDTMFIKGDEQCPAFTAASATFKQSAVYKDNLERTRAFYAQFWPVLQNVYDYQQANLTYANAYDIFDLIYVASIHNASVTANVTSDQLFQLRTLADSAELNLNYNASQPLRSIGGSALAGTVLAQMNQTVTSKGALKFSFFQPSYNNIMGLFGLTNLTAASPDFYGLPPYASGLNFEMFTEANVTAFPSNVADLRVRAMFRNGSDEGAPLQGPFRLFSSQETSLSWPDFVANMKRIAITNTGDWCTTCGSTAAFCLPYTSTANVASTATPAADEHSHGMSAAIGGVIGAFVTLAVVLIAGLAFWLAQRSKSEKPAATTATNPMEAKKADSLTSTEV